MPTALGNKMSGMKSAYNAGDQQSMGLGKELNERMKMNALGSNARFGAPAQVEPPKASPLGTSLKVDRVNPTYKPTAIPERLQALPKLKKGTPKVIKGGLAVLHAGEAVLSKPEAEQMRDRGAVALSGSDKPKAKKPAKAKGPKRMSIEKLDDNSFSVTHHNDGKEPMQPDQKFSARNAKHLVRHVRQTFGGAAEPEMPEAPDSGQPV